MMSNTTAFLEDVNSFMEEVWELKRDFKKQMEEVVLEEYGNDFNKFIKEAVMTQDYFSLKDCIEDLYQNDYS